MAENAGVVYTLAAGDEPAAIMELYRFANALNEHGHQTDIYVFDAGVRSGLDLSKDAKKYYSMDGVRIVPIEEHSQENSITKMAPEESSQPNGENNIDASLVTRIFNLAEQKLMDGTEL